MAPARRILIAGTRSWAGAGLHQALKRETAVEALVALESAPPQELGRLIEQSGIDTVVDARPIDRRRTRELLDGCRRAGGVSRLVLRSSADVYGAGPGAPAFFTEEMEAQPRTREEREVLAAEALAQARAAGRPELSLTILRLADPLGGDVREPFARLLSLPMVPLMMGFDPRCQFVHQEDVVGALRHCVLHDVQGVYNAAADGVLALSEVASLLGKPPLPVLAPWGLTTAGGWLRRLRLPVPVELLTRLRWGRGLDNRRLKTAGYAFRYTSREAVLDVGLRARTARLAR